MRKKNVNKLQPSASQAPETKESVSGTLKGTINEETTVRNSRTKTRSLRRSSSSSGQQANKVRTNGLKAVLFELFQRAVQAGKFDLAIKIAKEQFPNDVSITWKGDRCFINPTALKPVSEKPVPIKEPDFNEQLNKFLSDKVLANWRETLKRYGVEPVTWPLKRHVNRLCLLALGASVREYTEMFGIRPNAPQGNPVD